MKNNPEVLNDEGELVIPPDTTLEQDFQLLFDAHNIDLLIETSKGRDQHNVMEWVLLGKHRQNAQITEFTDDRHWEPTTSLQEIEEIVDEAKEEFSFQEFNTSKAEKLYRKILEIEEKL